MTVLVSHPVRHVRQSTDWRPISESRWLAINTLTVRCSPLKEAGTKCKPKNSPEKKNVKSLFTFLFQLLKCGILVVPFSQGFYFLFLKYFVDFVKMLACGKVEGFVWKPCSLNSINNWSFKFEMANYLAGIATSTLEARCLSLLLLRLVLMEKSSSSQLQRWTLVIKTRIHKIAERRKLRKEHILFDLFPL
jgi:hypothetical protein